MARRATVIRALRANGVFPSLYIIGADEFIPDAHDMQPDEIPDFPPQKVRQLYNALHPDAGYLSPSASSWFGDMRPEHFFQVGRTPVTRRLTVGGLTVALVFFPALDPELPEADFSIRSAVLAAAGEAADADLRIGICPWGFREEYAAREGLAQAFHIILGAGEGAHFALDAASMEPALWVRAADDGRSVMSLDIMTCPLQGVSPVWMPGINVQAREIRLEDSVVEDPTIQSLLEGFEE